MELLYSSGYGKKLDYYKNSHYLGFALLIIGVWSITEKRNFGYVLLIFAFGILIPYFILYFKNRKILKKYPEEINQVVAIFKQNPIVVLEFSETQFKYSDNESETIIPWNEFLGYTTIEENIFMFTNKYVPFVIGKLEAGEENYNEILEIVKGKLEK